jgi:integrase
MHAMLRLAAFAGLRVQEIAGLDRDDIIEAKGLIRVRHGKGQKERIVPLHPDVLAALRCVPIPKTGAIFVRPRGGRHLPYTVGIAIGATSGSTTSTPRLTSYVIGSPPSSMRLAMTSG